jgi:hypothetical protein
MSSVGSVNSLHTIGGSARADSQQRLSRQCAQVSVPSAHFQLAGTDVHVYSGKRLLRETGDYATGFTGPAVPAPLA